MDLPSPPVPDELPPDAEPEPDWKVYEHSIAHIEESYENCRVTRNHRQKGRRSGVLRQVDVWLEAEIGDNHTVTVAIECRRYGDRRVSIKDIDAFCGFLDDVGANKGVMISHSGYTKGAERRAEGAGIDLRTLTIEEAEEFDWDQFLERDSCQVSECYGTINWELTDAQSEAGHCGNCGVFHIRCGNCGLVEWFNEGSEEKCLSCGMRWRLIKEKGMTCDIKEIPPEPEEDEEGELEDEGG